MSSVRLQVSGWVGGVRRSLLGALGLLCGPAGRGHKEEEAVEEEEDREAEIVKDVRTAISPPQSVAPSGECRRRRRRRLLARRPLLCCRRRAAGPCSVRFESLTDRHIPMEGYQGFVPLVGSVSACFCMVEID